MSRNSRRKRNRIMARAKRSYPRKKGAYESIVRSGIAPHRLVKACHTGTYWRWEISNG